MPRLFYVRYHVADYSDSINIWAMWYNYSIEIDTFILSTSIFISFGFSDTDPLTILVDT